MKDKVIFVIDALHVGGAEIMAVNIANALIEESYEVHFCTTRSEGVLKDSLSDKIAFYCLERSKKSIVRAVLQMLAIIKTQKIVLAHVHTTSIFFMVLVKLFYPNLQIVWHNHTGKNSLLTNGPKYVLYKIILKFCNKIINVSSDLQMWSKKMIHEKKTFLLYNFPEIKKGKVTVLEGHNSIKIIILAALRPEKNHLLLIHTFIDLQKKYPITLHIVGKNHQDDYAMNLMKLVEENGVKGKVFFYDVLYDTHNVLKQADLGVLSSSSEGLPVALLEYGLAGLPVVVTDVGECKNVVQNYGLVVPPNHKFALYDALKQMIEDKNKREKMAIGFQYHIQNNYSKKSYINTLLKIYKSC